MSFKTHHSIFRRSRAIFFVLMLVSLLVFSLGLAGNTPTTSLAQSPCTSTANCLSQMTLAEKIGQMVQVENDTFAPCGANPTSDIAAYSIGSLLSGGGGGPNCT